jgi:hypothetical protein
MKQSKTQPDKQGQQKLNQHLQQKQQQKTQQAHGTNKQVEQNYQEHEHPESRMTD